MTTLTVAEVSCRFGPLAALDRVELHIAEGQRRALIGPNGAGKTTLLGVVAGTIRPTGGRVLLDGRNITTVSPARRARSGIARTFQTPALFDSLTALDNLRIGAWRYTHPRSRTRLRTNRRHVIDTRARHQLDTLGLAHLADTPAGALPHGQRRLLEIGLALAARPRLLLLDEPAAGLAAADLPRLLHCLHHLPAHVGVLLVEHHMDVVTAVAQSVTVLHHGRVLAEGTPAQVRNDPAVVEAYLGTTTLQPAVA